MGSDHDKKMIQDFGVRSRLSLKEKSSLASVMEALGDLLSGECMLHSRPNGGTLIFWRSVRVALLIYIFVVIARYFIDNPKENEYWAFKESLKGTIPWFGAIFAGVYAALYARFSAQWSYLAEFYNKILSAQIHAAIEGKSECPKFTEVLTFWKAAFIEDADEMHLASKPIYAAVILSMLEDEGVREALREYMVGGESRLLKIESSAIGVFECCTIENRRREAFSKKIGDILNGREN